MDLCAETPLSLQLRIMAQRFAHTIYPRPCAACLSCKYRASITDTQTPCTDKPNGGVRSLSREIDLGLLGAAGGEATRRLYVEASRPGVVRLPGCLVTDLLTGERDWLVLDCVTSVLA